MKAVPSDSERFNAVFNEMISLKDKYVVPKMALYKKRTRRSMILFRLTGILVIILSVSIPFLTTLDLIWKTIVVPIVAVVIAGLTGLISFYRWESSWNVPNCGDIFTSVRQGNRRQ